MEIPDGAADGKGNEIVDGWVFVTDQEMMFHTGFTRIANIQADQWNKLSEAHGWERKFRVCEVGESGEPVEVEDGG